MSTIKTLINAINTFALYNNEYPEDFSIYDIYRVMGYQMGSTIKLIKSYIRLLEHAGFISCVYNGSFNYKEYVKLRHIDYPDELTIKKLKWLKNDDNQAIYTRQCKIKKLLGND